VLTWSILLYAFSAFAAGFATNIYWLLFFRCLVFIGVCVEFVAAVAWLAELFPNPRQREKVLGYTQAFSSVGGLLVAVANGLAIKYANDLPAIYGQQEAWRYTLMSGVIPALPLILIRPFLPESPAWARKKAEGTLRRPSIGQLFSPELKRTTIVTTIMFAASYGAAFGAIQHMPQIAPGLNDVKPAVAAAVAPIDAKISAAKAAGTPPAEIAKLEGARRAAAARVEQSAASNYTKSQEVGGLVGRVILAMLAVVIVSRRSLIRLFQVPGLILMPIVFGWAAFNNKSCSRSRSQRSSAARSPSRPSASASSWPGW
jgi:MFS family permease